MQEKAQMQPSGCTGRLPLKLWPNLLDHYTLPALPALVHPVLALPASEAS